LLKTIERTVILEAWTNRIGRKALRDIGEAYRRMLCVMVDYAVEHKASQSTLHRTFYSKIRKEYPWLPTRIVKGCYRDAARRAKSFRELQEKGMAKTSKPEVRKVTITLSDSQDWRLEDGAIKVRTHKGWIELRYRNHRQLHRYLYSDWKLSEELRLKLVSGKVLVYLTFRKDFEVEHNPRNVVAVDVNENNVTLAVFKEKKLSEVYRVETSLGKIVISYSERRRRITKGRSTKTKNVKKVLRKLREKERKQDTVYKTAKIIEEIAIQNNAIVAVGGVFKGKKKLEEKIYDDNLRHRIHQWNISKLMEVLNNKPISVVAVNEAYTSSKDPFTGKRIRSFSPSMIRYALRGAMRIRAVKFRLRIAENGLDRDAIGAINIGLKYLSSDGRAVALPSTEPHGVRLKLVIPHRGLTPLTELKVSKPN